MQYGLTEDTIGQMINIFANMHKVEEAIIYGSRAMGNYQQGSDIDLASIRIASLAICPTEKDYS